MTFNVLYSFLIQVIPLAAEDYLLKWLDTRFHGIANEMAWSKWLDLLRLVYASLREDNDQKSGLNGDCDDSTLIDVEIFDDSEQKSFDETAYTSYKCYTFLVKCVNASTLNIAEREKILSEFPNLQNI